MKPSKINIFVGYYIRYDATHLQIHSGDFDEGRVNHV